jgi:vitamin B12/bleomycin/antimicrobial peptide transport system ATP-binding/permease protein
MDAQNIPVRVTAARFVRAVKNFVNSEVGWRAKSLFALLVALLCVASGFNVANSYVGRNFMTAIADRDQSQFVRWAAFYIGVFGASTLVSITARFAEERLALLWRQDLTPRSITLYLSNAAYYYFSVSGELANPDQRIAEDIRVFTVTMLSFVLMALNGVFAILAFSGVLWSISPLLFVVSVAYAACGSFLTIVLGRPLVKLNYDQLDKEASFRSGLISARDLFTCTRTPNRLCSRVARGGTQIDCCGGLTMSSPIFAGSPRSTATWDFYHRLQLVDPDHFRSHHRAFIHRRQD